MVLFATSIFAFSLLGIVILFTFKSWETQRGFVIAAELRLQADTQALRLKNYLMNSRAEAAKILPFMTLLARYLIHEAALSFARAAHFTGVQAHRLADMVSHKHHFERQAPRSEFLKQIGQITERPATTVMNPMDVAQVDPEHSTTTTSVSSGFATIVHNVSPANRSSRKKKSSGVEKGEKAK